MQLVWQMIQILDPMSESHRQFIYPSAPILVLREGRYRRETGLRGGGCPGRGLSLGVNG